MAESLGAFYIVAVIFSIVLMIAWVILPFALIGTKPLLRQLIAETKKTNELLEAVRRSSEPRVAPAVPIK